MPLGPDGYTTGYTGPKDTDESLAGDTFNWFKGFGESALWSIPELIGVHPSTETEEWRQDHPVGSVVSQVVGGTVPYLGWVKLARGIKPLEAAAEAASKAFGGKIAGAAARTVTELAPFEAGRIAANEAFGQDQLNQMLGSAFTDFAIGGGIGGLLHGIAAAGVRDPALQTIFPGIDISAPTPLLARQMRNIIDSGAILDPEMQSRAVARLRDTLALARNEELPKAQPYFNDFATDSLAPDADASETSRSFNRWFRMQDGPDKNIRVKKFARGVGINFPTDEAWQEEAKLAGLPDDFTERGQYFRVMHFNEDVPEKLVGTINSQITRNLESVGGGNFMTREVDDGLYVIARKYAGDVKTGSPEDKWMLFKTDQPGYFLPDADKYAKYMAKEAGFLPQTQIAADAGPVYNYTAGYVKSYPFHDWLGLVGPQPRGFGGKVIDAALPSNLVNNEAVQRLGEAAKGSLLPRIWQFAKYPRANYIVNVTKNAMDGANMTANELLFGRPSIDSGQYSFMKGLTQVETKGIEGLQPYKQLWDDINSNIRDSFFGTVWNRLSPAELDGAMAAGKISPEVNYLAKELNKIAEMRHAWTNKVEEATGHTQTQFDPKSYGIAKTWEGDVRIPLLDDSGKTVAMVGGATRKQALKDADRLISENPGWVKGTEISVSQDPAAIDKAIKAADLNEGQNVRGYRWDLRLPDEKESFQDIEQQVRREMNYQAIISTGDILSPEMGKLYSESPSIFKQATDRQLDYMGVQSPAAKWQNKMVDKIMAPTFGINSASKIVGLTNTYMANFTLGAFKLAFPVINQLQFIQTVNPEIALLMGKAPVESLAPYYSWFAAGGQKGPVGGIGVLNVLKMLGKGLGSMIKPNAEEMEALRWGASNRVLDARLVENYIGESQSKIGDLKAAFKSGEGFIDWLRALSEFMPAWTERTSRTHAFMIGYNMAKDFLVKKDGLKPTFEEAVQLAKEFTEKTMYLYGTADKSRIFNSPAGSLMGLFKNWMFHYLASMAQYTGEGVLRGNWSPLMWQTAGTFALGGLVATPIFGAANKFSQLWSDKSLLQLSYDHFNENADWMLYGMPTLMGVAMNSAVDIPALNNPVRDGASLFSVAAWSRVQALSKTVGDAIDAYQAGGLHPGYDRNTREQLLRAFAPVTLYRGMAAFANPDAIMSSTGYPLMKDPPLYTKLLYSAGFQPTELQRGYDISTALYENHDALKTEEAKLGHAWAEAEMDGNNERMAMIMRQGMTWGVDIGRVIRNGVHEIEQARKDIIERHLKPTDIPLYRRAVLGGREE